MYPKAKQVLLREQLTDGPYEFAGILIGDNKAIAMQNGAIIDLDDKVLKTEVVKEFPWWVNLSTHSQVLKFSK